MEIVKLIAELIHEQYGAHEFKINGLDFNMRVGTCDIYFNIQEQFPEYTLAWESVLVKELESLNWERI